MARPPFTVNALLLVASAGFALLIVREMSTPMSVVRARPPRPAASAPGSPGLPSQSSPIPAASIVSRNLFSPTRTEELATSVATSAMNVPRPSLHGVVLRDNGPVAFLEDPSTKRVAGYRVGDHVAGGTVQTIAADKIVLLRPEGPVDIRLHDPARPRPAAAGVTGQPGAPAAAAPTPFPAPPTPTAPMPGQPQQPGEGPAMPEARRPLPPSLQRRPGVPTTPTPDATQR